MDAETVATVATNALRTVDMLRLLPGSVDSSRDFLVRRTNMPDQDAPKADLGETTLAVYRLLALLEPRDQRRVFAAVGTLLGEQVASPSHASSPAISAIALPSKELIAVSTSVPDAASFLATKDPRTKVEELAVA